jgi:hypothetical protein
MRSNASANKSRYPAFTEGFVQAVFDIGTALMLVGDLIASWLRTAKKTDLSEPPDLTRNVTVVLSATMFGGEWKPLLA